MVLLTHSTVSIILTTGVICLFTFLLFLCGYVLQQQTVRSLQEALRHPRVPERYGPIPTLPAGFGEGKDVLGAVIGEPIQQIVVPDILGAAVEEGEIQRSDLEATNESVLAEENVPDSTLGKQAPMLDITMPPIDQPAAAEPSIPELSSLAYMLTIPQPSTICSAILFARQQRLTSTLQSRPDIIFLYPSHWESNLSPQYISALTLMRDVQADYSITYHPVQMSPVWSGVDVNAHLLGELQMRRWDFDRMLYLKSPGLATDTAVLDSALLKSDIETNWAPLAASAGMDPEALMYGRGKGLMMPKGEMRSLTFNAAIGAGDHLAGSAAWVLFDDEAMHDGRSVDAWSSGMFERLESGRRDVCEGRGLLRGEEEQLGLRRP